MLELFFKHIIRVCGPYMKSLGRILDKQEQHHLKSIIDCNITKSVSMLTLSGFLLLVSIQCAECSVADMMIHAKKKVI